MLNNIFKRKKTEEIESEIRKQIDFIMNTYPSGKRDFSLLNNLDNKIIQSDKMSSVQDSMILEFVILIADIFFMQCDMQEILNVLYDMQTFPDKKGKNLAQIWLRHEQLFKRKTQRVYSVLSPEKDIDAQLNEILDISGDCIETLYLIRDEVLEAREIYKQKDQIDCSTIEGLGKRFTILNKFMLTTLSENEIILAKKSLIALALNAGVEGVFETYEKIAINLLMNFYFSIGTVGAKIPTTDVLIADAIFKSKGQDIDLEPHISAFVKEYKNCDEMKSQFVLLNQVYKYLNLEIQI